MPYQTETKDETYSLGKAVAGFALAAALLAGAAYGAYKLVDPLAKFFTKGLYGFWQKNCPSYKKPFPLQSLSDLRAIQIAELDRHRGSYQSDGSDICYAQTDENGTKIEIAFRGDGFFNFTQTQDDKSLAATGSVGGFACASYIVRDGEGRSFILDVTGEEGLLRQMREIVSAVWDEYVTFQCAGEYGHPLNKKKLIASVASGP